jgi:hypothetical protein
LAIFKESDEMESSRTGFSAWEVTALGLLDVQHEELARLRSIVHWLLGVKLLASSSREHYTTTIILSTKIKSFKLYVLMQTIFLMPWKTYIRFLYELFYK